MESGRASRTPDDALFRHLAAVYADTHATMRSGHVCQDDYFENGTTNGAEWYDVPHGMQDFNYAFSNCFEISIELSCCKYPNASALEQEWWRNVRPLIAFARQVHSGVRGVVRDAASRTPIAKAVLSVDGVDHDVLTTTDGEFWRLLLPGRYNLTVRALGFNTLRREGVDVTDTTAAMAAQWLDLEMDRVQQQTGPPSDVVRPSDSPTAAAAATPITSTSTTPAPEQLEWQAWDEFSTKPEFLHRNYTEMESFLKT